MNTESKSEKDTEKRSVFVHPTAQVRRNTKKTTTTFLYYIGVFWDIIINIDYLIEFQVPVHKLSFETDATTVFG